MNILLAFFAFQCSKNIWFSVLFVKERRKKKTVFLFFCIQATFCSSKSCSKFVCSFLVKGESLMQHIFCAFCCVHYVVQQLYAGWYKHICTYIRYMSIVGIVVVATGNMLQFDFVSFIYPVLSERLAWSCLAGWLLGHYVAKLLKVQISNTFFLTAADYSSVSAFFFGCCFVSFFFCIVLYCLYWNCYRKADPCLIKEFSLFNKHKIRFFFPLFISSIFLCKWWKSR